MSKTTKTESRWHWITGRVGDEAYRRLRVFAACNGLNIPEALDRILAALKLDTGSAKAQND